MKVTRKCQQCGIEFERDAYGHRKDDPRWAIYCSMSCAAHGRWAGHARRSREVVRAKGHPLQNSQGRVLKYRMVLYDSIGPGTHPCHICERAVTWTVRTTRGVSDGELVVDHIDGDYNNNERENLAPACNPCNSLRGYLQGWRLRTGLPFSALLLDSLDDSV